MDGQARDNGAGDEVTRGARLIRNRPTGAIYSRKRTSEGTHSATPGSECFSPRRPCVGPDFLTSNGLPNNTVTSYPLTPESPEVSVYAEVQEVRLLFINFSLPQRYSLSSPSLTLQALFNRADLRIVFSRNYHGYRYRQVVQRQQRLWLHHAGQGRRRPFRSLLRNPSRRLQDAR
ncbi:hypothetical protein BDI4_630109 [Burkholderia diffusa]|nr:hypothetical protein BDI4_630109 [Burkholderia diffusa]